ncbi:fungal-specific transcription factor domain-containing protein [Aspergillus leporis]|uniref:Fungal-specific transcription factor domain-containing protein n=1 Tax=Aspergillus leporis TaxID=41062 RepID=A0A5N5X3U3_9EURO|nr:fungal-specific transcription factor domain-containing protein [Aspergillus leporis]
MITAKAKCRVACKSCNLRRVKCDRTEEAPCSYCQSAGQDCQPIVSRRGKYKRTHVKRTESQPALRRSQRQQRNESNHSSALPGESSPGTSIIEPSNSNFGDYSAAAEALSPRDPSPSSNVVFSRQDSQYPRTSPDGKVAYYGDSFNLEYMLHEMGSPLNASTNSCTLEHLYLKQLGRSTKDIIEEHSRNQRLRLKDKGAFQAFERDISDELIRTFFEICYPQIPIFDRADFQLKYETGRVSPLVLQAVYFVAITHCSESLYKRAGFTNRYLGTFTCYQRAKALYDANHESDAIATLQAVYLLSYWWGSPMEQKDMWYWVGIASSLAQSLGLHQRKTYDGMNERITKLWRRIWWTTYIHDIAVALMLGRTPHINDAYCSVDMLREDDFEFEDSDPINLDLFGKPSHKSQVYVVYLAKLYLRTSKCILDIFGAKSNESTATKNLDDLTSWIAALPKELQRQQSTISVDNGLWASLFHLSYFTVQILLRRNGFKHHDRLKYGTVVFDAAVQVVRILEDIVSSQLLLFTLLRGAPAIFAALSVQIANIRGCPSHVVELSKHRARLCMFVTDKLKDHAPPLMWYYRLFVRLLHGMGCQISGEDSQEASHHFVRRDQRLQELTSPTPDFSYNDQMGHDCSQEAEPNNPTHDLLVGDPALCDFGPPGTMTSFPFSGLLNSDLIDGTLFNIENFNLDQSHL